MTTNLPREFVLTLSCRDAHGIVYAVSGALFKAGCNIIDSQQFGDASTQLFFMRVHFSAPADVTDVDQLTALFAPIGAQFAMSAQFYALAKKANVLIMVSKIGHCLNDLLFRWKSGLLPVNIAAVASNHRDFEALAQSNGVPFHFFDLTDDKQAKDAAKTKQDKEALVINLLDKYAIDCVVLARYMQILSPALCQTLTGRAINIHHSFLPSFKGAKPYYQAHERGVKLIGATAHYVTSDLDEGPIIEQDVARVDHSMSPDELTAIGRDSECVVLARAVRWHVEHRILMNGSKTVIFK